MAERFALNRGWRFQLLLRWYLLVQWWDTDIWGWVVDVCVCDPEKGMVGRRTGKKYVEMPCPGCKRCGEKPMAVLVARQLCDGFGNLYVREDKL